MKRRKEVIHRCEGMSFIRTPSQEKALLSLLRDAFPETYAEGIIASMQSMTQYFILKRGKVVAILSLAGRAEARDGRAYRNMIFNVATDRKYRGRGYMTDILGTLLRPRKTFHLEVYHDNLPAIALYHKNGFRVIDTIDTSYGRSSYVMKSTPGMRKRVAIN